MKMKDERFVKVVEWDLADEPSDFASAYLITASSTLVITILTYIYNKDLFILNFIPVIILILSWIRRRVYFKKVEGVK